MWDACGPIQWQVIVAKTEGSRSWFGPYDASHYLKLLSDDETIWIFQTKTRKEEAEE